MHARHAVEPLRCNCGALATCVGASHYTASDPTAACDTCCSHEPNVFDCCEPLTNDNDATGAK